MTAVPVTRARERAVESAVSELAAAFGNRLVTSHAVRGQHANTTTWVAPQAPDAAAQSRVPTQGRAISEQR
jgi:D-lactate dehydrogenase (cytochrome)